MKKLSWQCIMEKRMRHWTHCILTDTAKKSVKVSPRLNQRAFLQQFSSKISQLSGFSTNLSVEKHNMQSASRIFGMDHFWRRILSNCNGYSCCSLRPSQDHTLQLLYWLQHCNSVRCICQKHGIKCSPACGQCLNAWMQAPCLKLTITLILRRKMTCSEEYIWNFSWEVFQAMLGKLQQWTSLNDWISELTAVCASTSSYMLHLHVMGLGVKKGWWIWYFKS